MIQLFVNTLILSSFLDVLCKKVVLEDLKVQPASYIFVNQFHATGLFLYPLKTPENLRSFDVFRGSRKTQVA